MSELNPQPLPPGEVASHLIETKAVDFQAIGAALAKFGPSLALADEPGENFFCGTGRNYFLRVFVLSGGGHGPVLEEFSADLGTLTDDLTG
jgi:hypothetical protein